MDWRLGVRGAALRVHFRECLTRVRVTRALASVRTLLFTIVSMLLGPVIDMVHLAVLILLRTTRALWACLRSRLPTFRLTSVIILFGLCLCCPPLLWTMTMLKNLVVIWFNLTRLSLWWLLVAFMMLTRCCCLTLRPSPDRFLRHVRRNLLSVCNLGVPRVQLMKLRILPMLTQPSCLGVEL